jgi:hypothetical protein
MTRSYFFRGSESSIYVNTYAFSMNLGSLVPTKRSWRIIILISISSAQYSGNACYHSVQNLLSSRLLSKNIKIRI